MSDASPKSELAEVSDVDLMLRAQADEIAAFEELVNRYERPLIGYFTRMTRDRFGADDYAQDVFVRLWTSRHLYQPSGKFTNYLFQIARNHWINEYKRKRLRPIAIGAEEAAEAPDVRHRDRPPELLANRELAEQIESALASIPEEQREAFVLSRYHKMKYQEIADLTGVPVRTVESRLLLATQKLMAALSRYVRT